MVLGTLDEVGLAFISTCLSASKSSSDAAALQEAFPDSLSLARILRHPIHRLTHPLSTQPSVYPFQQPAFTGGVFLVPGPVMR